ncbi:MAG: FG-GAP repeat domain-containing protein, partial [Thermodesulfobacteriota bacterium]
SLARADARPKVLLLPFQIHAPQEQHSFLSQGLRSMFVSRLTGEGLDILPEDVSRPLLTEEDQKGVHSDERASELGMQAGAEHVIFGTVTAMGGSFSLDLGIVDLKKDPPKLTRVSEATEESRLIPKVADVAYQFRGIIEGVDPRRFQAGSGSDRLPEGEGTMGLFFRPTAESYGFEPSGFTNMRAMIVSLDTGDLNGDGKAEIVLVSRNRLILASRDEDTMVMKSQMNVRTGEEFLRVSVGDMDRDGKAEIYLVSLYGQRAQTVVLTWDGEFTRRAEQPGHLNLVKNESMGRRFLLYQGSRTNSFFSGDIFLMDLGPGNELLRKEVLPLEGARIYTLAVSDLNRDGHIEFLGLDQDKRLNIWDSNGKSFWQGNQELGGSNNVVEIGDRPGPGDLAPQTEINGRVIVADIDGDGTEEVIAARNIAPLGILDRLKVYKTSKLIAYKPEGLSLERAWSTREIRYAMADIQKEGRTIYLGGHKGEYSKMGVGSSRIMWFE